MRCVCCNKALSDYEATRRHAVTREFLDMCNECFTQVNESVTIPNTDRPDLLTEETFFDGDIDNIDNM